MRRIITSFTLACMTAGSLLLAPAARAEIEVPPLTLGEPTCWHGLTPCMQLTGGSATLALSPALLSQLDAHGLAVSAAEPATLAGATVSMPVTRLDHFSPVDPGMLTIWKYGFDGVLGIRTVDDTSTASLDLSRFRIDPGVKRLSARVFDGAHALFNVPIFNYAVEEGDSRLNIQWGEQTLSRTFSQLTLTPQALGYFERTFQLDAARLAQLAETDFGTLTLTAQVTSVPEPTTWMLMGVGLFGLFAARRRRVRRAA